ncbi:class I SAM-dependent DNA methyltransferase [Thalassospira alkalitolerans]|uniref:class I SAM-dependent DNA methyltransferase n=1 Tax=Thalassospira alkalitolerans TaxID=1293890 RepID=UPI0030EE0274|tara:strand:- start:10154 stop:13024 length:2871 start_codon:yes stop_codon:yes gene_type:complete
MTPTEFVAKWKASTLTERAAAQSQFVDLCKLLDEPAPSDADATGESYAFEKGANKSTGSNGWADVWKQGHFAWEYKGKGRNLDKAFAQLQQYAGALGNPPLLVVSDMHTFRIHTNWTNTVSEIHILTLDDLLDAGKRQILKDVMCDPERLRPGKTRQALTEEAAEKFATLARDLRAKGYEADRVAHFVNRLVFCMFAEDVHLLPNRLFQKMLETGVKQPEEFGKMSTELFGAMRSGGSAAWESIEWFNGGLFDDDESLPLSKEQIQTVLKAARLDWSEVDPSIFGTLFERGLDPDKRSQLGAHYTDRDKIMMIIEPVIIRPLSAEWDACKAEINAIMTKRESTKDRSARTRAQNRAIKIYQDFLDRLRHFRVLDPACGSGNFLYLALLSLKDLEHRAGIEVEAMGLAREFPQIGPECISGIEINPYAAELARISVWIGEIQWMRRNGYNVSRNPILRPLTTIENRDALLPANPDGKWPDVGNLWPDANVIIGNPPFLGDKMMIAALGEEYVQELRKAYSEWVPGGADLVCYWFAIADHMMGAKYYERVGFVSTNSIRSGANRKVLDSIAASHKIFDVWSDESWTVDGASVRVSLVCFDWNLSPRIVKLDGAPISEIYSDLSGGAVNLTRAKELAQNSNISFIGTQKNGPFDVPGELARNWLQLPQNPNGRKNSDVLRPWVNTRDITAKPSGKWIVDFGVSMSLEEAALYEAPFQYIKEVLSKSREGGKEAKTAKMWWLHQRSRPKMRKALEGFSRYIVTTRHSKYRLFVWADKSILPDSATVAIARDDDVTFGILHSKFHELWTLKLCSFLGVGNDPRYTPSTTFETFPFPDGLTPDLPAPAFESDLRAEAISEAAKKLDELRRNWLNPSDLVQIVPEVVTGYPDRILPKDEDAAKILKKRTLTNLYNERPAWLENAHRVLDEAVAAAYGWPADITDDEALANLLALNIERAKAQE